jgi:hypothetical protein
MGKDDHDFQVLEEDDPVKIWFERCLDFHGGLGCSFASAVSMSEDETICA